MRTIRSRLIVIVGLALLSGWLLVPKNVTQRVRDVASGRMKDTTVRRVPINLGLDLQGGIHFQREGDAALEVEPEGDGNAAHGRVRYAAARDVTHPLGDVLWDEEPAGEERQPYDDDQSAANRAHATLYGLRTWRAATASRSIWATSASRDGNVCTARSRRTHSTVTGSPYSSPAKSNRSISRPRAAMPNVGRGPWFIMPP